MKVLEIREFSDHRGYVVNPFERLERTGDVSNCHAFTIRPGTARGGHAHPERNEKVLLLSGTIRVISGEGQTILSAPALFEIPPGETHTFHCDQGRASVLLCWSDSRP